MWGFRAKNSGFNDNIDDFWDNSENSEHIPNLTYAQVTKTQDGYYFRALSAMKYKELRNDSNTKNEVAGKVALKRYESEHHFERIVPVVKYTREFVDYMEVLRQLAGYRGTMGSSHVQIEDAFLIDLKAKDPDGII